MNATRFPSIERINNARTFGELAEAQSIRHRGVSCSYCKLYFGGDASQRVLLKYSTRHYICPACLETRHDVVLPSVKKREKFERKMRDLREDVCHITLNDRPVCEHPLMPWQAKFGKLEQICEHKRHECNAQRDRMALAAPALAGRVRVVTGECPVQVTLNGKGGKPE